MVDIEGVRYTHVGELPGFLCKECLDHLKLFVARLGLTIDQAAHSNELSLLAVERVSGAFAETVLVKRG